MNQGNHSSYRKAFSLIELSIVILIIGIIIAGVTSGSRIVSQMRITSAQTQTQSSPVAGIKNLATWLESVSDASFSEIEAQDSTAVSTWYDMNPQSSLKNNATQSTTSDKPLYVANCINSLPCIRFDGASDMMSLDGTMMVGTDYTIFVIDQRRIAGNGVTIRNFISGTGNSINANLHLGYHLNYSTVKFAHFSNDLDTAGIVPYTSPTPRMHTFRFSKTDGKIYWMNGGSTPENSNSSQTAALLSNAGWSIGRHIASPDFYNGDVAEIIIYLRALKTEERNSVENYLAKKWGLKIS